MTSDPPEAGPERPPEREAGPERRSSFRLPGPRSVKWGVLGLLVVGIGLLLLKGADQPEDPYLRSDRQRVEGFGQIAFSVDRMASTRRCALLAQSEPQRSKGLMNRTDLAGHDGMIFAFPSDTSNSFYMLNTPMPLSIAWFDAEGRFVSSTDMEPCLDRPDCPLYSPAGPYRYALEVPKGGLEALGIGPGAVISIGGPCSDPTES
ncbi:MAG: DUF192 domain-containing protein [Acidimicrobiales bacterium]